MSVEQTRASADDRSDRDLTARRIDLGYAPAAAIAVVLFGMGAHLSAAIKPVILDTHVKFLNVTQSAAGDLLFVEFLAAAVASFLIASRVHVWDRRVLAIGALAVMVAGDAASLFARDFVAMGVLRFIAGAGHGLGLGLLAASIAGSSQPDRLGGIYTVLAMLSGMLVGLLAPSMQAAFGGGGLFLMFVLGVVPAAVMVARFPRYPQRRVRVGLVPSTTAELDVKTIASVLLAIVLYYVSVGGVWPYFGQLLQGTGLSYESSARVIGVATGAGVMGALTASVLGSRFGRLAPVTFALSVQSLACFALIAFPHSRHVAEVAAICFTFSWLMFFPYLLGILSAMDGRGRVSVLGFSAQLFCFGFGPFVAARLVDFGGMQLIAWMGAVPIACALLMFVSIVRRVEARACNA